MYFSCSLSLPFLFHLFSSKLIQPECGWFSSKNTGPRASQSRQSPGGLGELLGDLWHDETPSGACAAVCPGRVWYWGCHRRNRHGTCRGTRAGWTVGAQGTVPAEALRKFVAQVPVFEVKRCTFLWFDAVFGCFLCYFSPWNDTANLVSVRCQGTSRSMWPVRCANPHKLLLEKILRHVSLSWNVRGAELQGQQLPSKRASMLWRVVTEKQPSKRNEFRWSGETLQPLLSRPRAWHPWVC